MTTYISSISAPGSPDRGLLGGKGAELASLVQMGLPVPPGFTLTTATSRHVLDEGTRPPGVARQVEHHLAAIEEETGQRFGDAQNPLLLAVRAGAPVSMPGMMETVLDVGLSDVTVAGLARRSGDEQFAWDCYRRLVQLFGEIVLGVPAERFEAVLAAVRAQHGLAPGDALGPLALRDVVERSHAVCRELTGRTLPQDPREQLEQTIYGLFESWLGAPASAYRRKHGISDDLGVAVSVQAMVYGNRGPRSGSGVAFTRDPRTGEPVPWGEYHPAAQGADVVAGTGGPAHLDLLLERDPSSYRRLHSIMGTLERNHRDMCEIEFTVEDGRLWVLQARAGERSPAAAFRIATDLVEEGWITDDDALLRVTGEQLTQLMSPRIDRDSAGPAVAAGHATSPGVATGRVALDARTAATLAERGEDIVLIRPETHADDLPGLLSARAIVTSRGGPASHAAVVARGVGLPAVCGVATFEVDADARHVRVGAHEVIAEGDVVTVDGTSGRVYRGRHRTVPSEVALWLDGNDEEPVAPVVASVARLLAHADRVRRLHVRADADTATDVRRAVRHGADGVGLCRTESLLHGERKADVEALLLGPPEDRERALRMLTTVHREAFTLVMDAADGRPVTIRLLDAPLHDLLPDTSALVVQIERVADADRAAALRSRLAGVLRLQEENPMAGLRGVRLAIVCPEVVTAQVTGALEAAADLRDRGRAFHLELVAPMVAAPAELELVAGAVAAAAEEVAARRGRVPYRFGSAVETPRAALTSDRLAAVADFLAIDTDQLTELVWGLSRATGERSVLPRYLEEGVLRASPFLTLDREGVGALVASAVERSRAARAGIPIGVSGEHTSDAASVVFFEDLGIDHVSCAPQRVPAARLEAGRAALITAARVPAHEAPDAPEHAGHLVGAG